MADAIIWADKLPDIIKKWILIVPMIFAFLGSGAGIYQTYAKGAALEEAENNKNKAVHEVAAAFQKTLIEVEPKPKPKFEITKQVVRDICNNIIKSHRGEFH